MPAKTSKPLSDLHKKALADGHWPVVAATQAALADEANLDLQINVIGAMHESGFLKNRMEPLWKLWRPDATAWTARCVERLRSADRDYWAVAALLGLDIKQAWPVFKQAGYAIMAVRAIPPFTKSLMHYVTLSFPKEASRVWNPVIELGWDAKTGEISDAARFRAILFDQLEKKDASYIGKGSGSNFLRAALPHGSWRVVSMDFDLPAEAIIPLEKTVLKKA
ncbi:MAG: hypothetical protein ACO1QS_01415 [Verrucomicrobiota bacterium]